MGVYCAVVMISWSFITSGDFEGIKDIITWKRESKILEKLDPKQIQQEENDAYTDCLEDVPGKTTEEKVVVSILVDMYREYELWSSNSMVHEGINFSLNVMFK